MKHILLFCLSLVMVSISFGQSSSSFNKTLADSLGADEYGMKQYMLIILKTGSDTSAGKEKTDQLFRGHMANINKMATDGKLVVAGPFGKNDRRYRGIFILNVKTEVEAKSLLANDPAISGNLLAAEIYPWYGSAALPMYLDDHKKIERAAP